MIIDDIGSSVVSIEVCNKVIIEDPHWDPTNPLILSYDDIHLDSASLVILV